MGDLSFTLDNGRVVRFERVDIRDSLLGVLEYDPGRIREFTLLRLRQSHKEAVILSPPQKSFLPLL